MHRFVRFALCAALMLSFSSPASAIILAAKEARNTRAPTGVIKGSGWQYQGQWGNFLGTPIQRQYFITAGHIGGNVGDPFVYNGVAYNTVATYNDPLTDLQIWKVDGIFSDWARLYKKNGEAGQGVVIFGRGTARGAEVNVNGQLKGWLWGEEDHVQSWGKNLLIGPVSSTTDAGEKIADARIYWKFDRNGVGHEGTISSGDSGGGVFLRDNGLWVLAGINHSAEATFSLPGSGEIQKGAILDAGGLQSGDTLIPDTLSDNPTRAYATRISPRLPWIVDVLRGNVAPSAAIPGPGVPEPSSAAMLLAAGLLILRRRR